MTLIGEKLIKKKIKVQMPRENRYIILKMNNLRKSKWSKKID